jgi:hypothetical protein
LVYEDLPWYGNELDLAASRLEAALKTVSVLRDEVSMAFLRKKERRQLAEDCGVTGVYP